MDARDRRLRREFHITLEQREKVRKFQKNNCAICGRRLNKLGKPLILAVDHCHTSGLVRGLLCWQCNKGIAVFMDNPDWLANAARYLERPPFTQVFGKEFYTAPGKIGSKKRNKVLKKMGDKCLNVVKSGTETKWRSTR